MEFQLHIGVLAFPFGTHPPPLLALVQRLATFAPGALFSFLNSATSNAALFKEQYDNIRAHEVWDGTPEGFTGSHFEAVGLFLKASSASFEKAIEEAEVKSGLKICCLITDAFLWFASDMAEKRGVPLVSFWASASCSLSSHMYTDQIVKALESTETEKQEKALSFIPGLEMATTSDLAPEIFLDNSPSPMAIPIYKMVEQLPRSTAVVVNSFEEIDPIITKDLKLKFRHFLNVGLSNLVSPTSPPAEDKTGCLSWLEKQSKPNSVIYIGFGSVVTPPENELVALAEALEECGFPFLWSLKDYAVKSLPAGFLDRTKKLGKIVAWAPQPQVLAHETVGVFINHGGYNSILESISSCVPLICRPFFGDQKLNSRMVQDSWKIGVRVKGGVFTKSETVECLMEMMTTEKGMKVRENVCVLKKKGMDAVGAQGSSSTNFNKLLEIIGTAHTT